MEGISKKSKLEEFLKNDQSSIKERLSLIKILLSRFNPDDKFCELKKINDKINKDINKLKYIKDNIIIYYKEFYQDIIKRIIDVIKNNQNKKIFEYKNDSFRELIYEIENLKNIADKINRVKNFLLFNVIYEMNLGRDENNNFNKSCEILDEIGEYLKNKNDIIDLNKRYKEYFNKIKEKLANNGEEADKFIENMKDYYSLKNINLIRDLTILFKIKKYELDINSIIFFFENYFEKDNQLWNEMLYHINYKNKWEEDFRNIKIDLYQLKENEIYDYKTNYYYYKFFTSLYDKKEDAAFLFNKTGEEILKLKDNILHIDTTINIKDILDTEKCLYEIHKMKNLKDNFKVLEYIKKMSRETISLFENLSKIYLSIIQLEINDSLSDNIYEKVVNIITDAIFNILQDSENFKYYNDKESKYENITMKELFHINNHIHIKNEEKNIEDEIFKSKYKVLLFYKDVISKLEVIEDYMNVLRTKGSNLPIKISIKINIKNREPIIEYYLYDKKKSFEEIRDFLLEVKNTYISQLDSIYKEKSFLRFLYGKQFINIIKNIENNHKIDSLLRYILNNTNSDISIKEGNKSKIINVNYFIKQYDLYNINSLESISNYIITLFQNNDTTIEDHYNRFKIKSNDLKGIYLYECENCSMEEYILNLFLDKLSQLPIAQNILIINKETSSEEMQAFLHRAILCNYNSLFVVEINDSFSEFQQSIMNTYIDNLLSYKNNKYNEETKENIDKNSTNEYLDSCIFFIYDKKNKNNNIKQFLKVIRKFIRRRGFDFPNLDKS